MDLLTSATTPTSASAPASAPTLAPASAPAPALTSAPAFASTFASPFDWLVAFFATEQWKVQSSASEQTVSFVFDGKAGPWTTVVKVFDAEQQLAVYGLLPFTIEAPRRRAAAELITRVNYGLVIGNFEMDFGDGELRYKTSLDFEGVGLSAALLTQVLQLVRANLAIVDSYLPAFIALASRGMSPTAALALVE